MIKHEESGHWYNLDGSFNEACTGMKLARELNCFPGATSVLKMKANPFLENWKVEQGIISSLTLPRESGESEEDFAKRVVSDSRQGMKDSADLGTIIHDYAERLITYGESAPIPEEIAHLPMTLVELADAVRKYTNRGGFVEESIPVVWGFGGRCDYHDSEIVLDWKSQNVKDRPNFYTSFCSQKAGYDLSFDPAQDLKRKLVTVVVSTNRDNQGCWIKEWKPKDKLLGQYDMLTLTESWIIEKKFHMDYLPKILAKKQELADELSRFE